MGVEQGFDAFILWLNKPLFHALLLGMVGLWAGIQNAMAGGGSFVTIPALMAVGLTPIEANITSTVALFPGQAVSGTLGYRALGKDRPRLLARLIGVSVLGGAFGGLLLLGTPPQIFSILLPWLVLFATLLFAWGSFRKKKATAKSELNPSLLLASQFAIAVYGGYFGGGNWLFDAGRPSPRRLHNTSRWKPQEHFCSGHESLGCHRIYDVTLPELERRPRSRIRCSARICSRVPLPRADQREVSTRICYPDRLGADRRLIFAPGLGTTLERKPLHGVARHYRPQSSLEVQQSMPL